MSENEKTKIISDRVQREWIHGCPVQVNRTCIFDNGDGIFMHVTAVLCGGFSVAEYTADVEFTGAKRQNVGKIDGVSLKVGQSSDIPVSFSDAVYAYAIVRSVTFEDGTVWKNETGERGSILPEQEVYWQTDPLYTAVRVECADVTDAKYKPCRIDGAWRCACGQVNLDSSETCGACGCSLSWLDSHLDPAYLEMRSAEIADKTEKEAVREKKKRDNAVSDTTKMILILASFGLVVALVVLTFTLFIPLGKYGMALSLAENGEYDEAIEIFGELGSFKNSSYMAADTNYKKAQMLTGLDEVNMLYSEKAPWFSVTEDGVLSFKKDEYEDHGGTWEHFVIPDMVDDIVVRELDRNFFMNCDELVSVSISDCVEVVGEQCFYNCKMLENVYFGKNVTTICPRAFINCYALTEIEIPDTVTSLGLRAFNNCIKLHKVVLGNGITEIGSYQFSYCVELERITLKAPITSVGEYAFSECTSLAKVHCRFAESEWTNPTVGIGNEAFENAEILFE